MFWQKDGKMFCITNKSSPWYVNQFSLDRRGFVFHGVRLIIPTVYSLLHGYNIWHLKTHPGISTSGRALGRDIKTNIGNMTRASANVTSQRANLNLSFNQLFHTWYMYLPIWWEVVPYSSGMQVNPNAYFPDLQRVGKYDRKLLVNVTKVLFAPLVNLVCSSLF